MVLIAAAALLAAAPNSGARPVVGVRQAQASVRIISAARIKLGEEASAQGAPRWRSRTVQTADGPRPARLVEFE